MSLGEFIKSQFIEVIEWTDSSSDVILYRFPVKDKEIKMNAQLIVRESQIAVFVNEGIIADIFDPGRYQIDANNIPILTKLASWKYGFNSPFKAEVYFINTKQFINQKWGTINPIPLKDNDLGFIRLRGYGNFAFKIIEPKKFIKEISGTNNLYHSEEIAEYIKNNIIASFSDIIGEIKISVLEIPSNYERIANLVREKIAIKFAQYGIIFSGLSIENISLPDEVEKYIDKRTSMAALGDLDNYSKFQTAEAIKDAANNPGGLAGLGVGFGAGIALGKKLADNLESEKQESNLTKQKEIRYKKCNKCGLQIDSESNFCPECGEKQVVKVVCPNCNSEIKANSKFCEKCGTKI